MKRFWIILAAVFIFSPVYAQHPRITGLKGVRGEFAATTDMEVTFSSAKENARNAAKKAAIASVCGEKMNIWDKMSVSSAGDSFNSLAISQVDGEIVDFNIVDEGVTVSPVRKSEIIFYCVADVNVRRGVEPDIDFTARVDKLKPVYRENEEIQFSVTPLKDCYLKIFLLEDLKIGYLIYPNEREPEIPLEAGKTISFPRNIIYSVTLDQGKTVENNQMVFVFTKKLRPFLRSETSRDKIESWIMKIPADEKYLYISSFDVVK